MAVQYHLWNIFCCLINISQTHDSMRKHTKEKHVKHFLVVYILHKKITSVSKLMSPQIKSSFISIFSLNTDSFQNLQYINTDYGLKIHRSWLKK